LDGVEGAVARFTVLRGSHSKTLRAIEFIKQHNLSFPVVLKPDVGERGSGVAIVKNEARLDPTRGAAASSLSLADWKTLFDPGLRAAPDAISSGADIVLWYSVEVPQQITVPGYSTFTPPTHTSVPPTTFSARSPGTILISGIFFAHDAELTGLTVGSTGPAYRPRDEPTIRSGRQWFRPAS
jgi:hypothetical protein